MKAELFDLSFDAVNENTAAKMVIDAALANRKGLVVTPNVDHIVSLRCDSEMRRIFNQALFRFADGMPLVWFSRLVGKPLPCRVTGADLLPNVARLAAATNLKIFFLGGQPLAAEKASQILAERYPGFKVAGYYCPPFGFEKNAAESAAIVTAINKSGANILAIGVGTPKQEKWLDAHLCDLNVGPILAIGAAIDFSAGFVKRPPIWMQRCGLEWLGRLFAEPRRLWRRYLLKDSIFLILMIREAFKQKWR